MVNYVSIIRNAFGNNDSKDATFLFETCIKNAFPTFNFRKLELIRLLHDEYYMIGKSLNHVFEIHAVSIDDNRLWEVHCHRVSMGKTPDKHVYLDFTTLGFVQYKEV